jgi:hypothetical protein
VSRAFDAQLARSNLMQFIVEYRDESVEGGLIARGQLFQQV